MAGHYKSHQQGSNATTEVVAGTTDNAYTKAKGTNQVVYFRGLYLEADFPSNHLILRKRQPTSLQKSRLWQY